MVILYAALTAIILILLFLIGLRFYCLMNYYEDKKHKVKRVFYKIVFAWYSLTCFLGIIFLLTKYSSEISYEDLQIILQLQQLQLQQMMNSIGH